MNALKDFQPSLFALFAKELSAYNTPKEQDFVNHAFATCEDISVDFAIMEHAKNIDVVFASRFLEQNQATIPLAKRMVLKSVAKITKALTDVQLSDAHNGLRALTVEATRAIDLTQNGMAHATQLVSLVLQANLKYTEVPVTVLYTPYSRSKGQSVFNSINIALDLIWG